MTRRSEHTPEKVAELMAEANGVSTNAVVANPRRHRNMILRLADALKVVTAERDAYKRAKAENDERFMIERDEARRERDEALAAIREALAFESILPAIASEPRRILSRITDKEQN